MKFYYALISLVILAGAASMGYVTDWSYKWHDAGSINWLQLSLGITIVVVYALFLLFVILYSKTWEKFITFGIAILALILVIFLFSLGLSIDKIFTNYYTQEYFTLEVCEQDLGYSSDSFDSETTSLDCLEQEDIKLVETISTLVGIILALVFGLIGWHLSRKLTSNQFRQRLGFFFLVLVLLFVIEGLITLYPYERVLITLNSFMLFFTIISLITNTLGEETKPKPIAATPVPPVEPKPKEIKETKETKDAKTMKPPKPETPKEEKPKNTEK